MAEIQKIEVVVDEEFEQSVDDIFSKCERIEKKLDDLSGEIKRLKTYLYFIPMTLGAAVSGLIINPILNHLLK